jgi:predicted O-linked N-acetylglucosamine transferase (SPINDLY family)
MRRGLGHVRRYDRASWVDWCSRRGLLPRLAALPAPLVASGLAHDSRYTRLLEGLWRSLPEPALPAPDSAPGKRPGRIRVGFANSFFRDCTAGHYFRSWVTDLPDKRFEKLVYVLGGREDAMTQRIRDAAARSLRLDGDLVEAARRIRGDRLDVLVYPELGMDGRAFALAALRLAPLQCAGWGHPVTTGLPSVDCFFSSALMEPPDGQDHYSERLVLLPGLGTRYECPAVGTAMTRGDLGLPEARTLFLFPHAVFKIRPENDRVLARVLAGDPQGVLVLCAGETERMTRRLLDRLLPVLHAQGIGAERVKVLPLLSRAAYLEVNRLCDVILDATHWSGGNTTLDAIAAGLPVVTRWGRFMRGRQSAGMLAALGLDELIAADEEEFVTRAREFGQDPARRRAISTRMQGAREELFDRREPVAALAD